MITKETIIDGLDVKAALARMGGKENLYTRLMISFLGGTEIDALSRSMREGNAVEAAINAHTLKGTAANLSAYDVQAAAAELDIALKEKGEIDARTMNMFAIVEERFRDLISSCAPYIQ
ncbi:MAG: Hpt domain-containing protein [Oscillospiraceae bacterium]|nr:Hpt domain-containing protein [Oscillospiraceae bacterium]